MRPDTPRVLNGVMIALATQVVQHLRDAYAVQTTSLGAALAGYAAQEFDRAAARLVEENAAIRAIFDHAADVVIDPELRTALAAAASSGPDIDLRVSSLQRTNDWLRALLIRLHEHVEQLSSARAREVDAEIWSELVESTARRHFAPMI